MHADDGAYLAVPLDKWDQIETAVLSLRTMVKRLSQTNTDLVQRIAELEAELTEVRMVYDELMKRQVEADQFIIYRDRIREKLDSLLSRLELLELPLQTVESSPDGFR